MNEEIIKKIAEEEFINNTMKHLDSALIFVYIKNLEKENVELNRMCEIYSQSLYNADLKKAEQEIERLNNIIDELEKWLNEYYKSNRKWYNTELSNHDKQYYEEIYRNTEFMIVKFLKQLKELEENK